MARAINLTIAGRPAPKRRPSSLVRLGCRLNPGSITDAWYAQGCPRKLDMSGIPLRDRVVWSVSKWLRGCR